MSGKSIDLVVFCLGRYGNLGCRSVVGKRVLRRWLVLRFGEKVDRLEFFIVKVL